MYTTQDGGFYSFSSPTQLFTLADWFWGKSSSLMREQENYIHVICLNPPMWKLWTLTTTREYRKEACLTRSIHCSIDRKTSYVLKFIHIGFTNDIFSPVSARGSVTWTKMWPSTHLVTRCLVMLWPTEIQTSFLTFGKLSFELWVFEYDALTIWLILLRECGQGLAYECVYIYVDQYVYHVYKWREIQESLHVHISRRKTDLFSLPCF